MMQGDTIKIVDPQYPKRPWGTGFIERPTNDYGDTVIFIRNDYGYDKFGNLMWANAPEEPRWFFAVYTDPKFEGSYTTTRMVLTEKNRYAIKHGDKDFDRTWQ
jgi:hypothetical protein